MHLQRNVLTKVPWKRVAREVPTLFRASGRRDVQRPLEQLTARWQAQLPEAMDCLTKDFAAATTFYAFPAPHWKRIRTTNGIERLHRGIKRRTKAVGAFPDRASALRPIRAVALKVTAIWRDRQYVDVSLLENQEVDQAA